MAGGERPQQVKIDELRALIEAVVSRRPGHHPASSPARAPGWTSPACPFFPPSREESVREWGFGLANIDGALPRGGLDSGGLHELKPLRYGDGPAAAVLAATLLARLRPSRDRPLLWVADPVMGRETGCPYGPGLGRLGLDPTALLFAEPRRPIDALWAMEEGVRSSALTGVLGLVASASETTGRRLALAARASATPCLLLTGHREEGLSAAHTRWRVSALESAPHPLVPEAPGAPRWELSLERCREGAGRGAWVVEWSDEARAFRMAPPLADRPDAPRRAGARSR